MICGLKLSWRRVGPPGFDLATRANGLSVGECDLADGDDDLRPLACVLKMIGCEMNAAERDVNRDEVDVRNAMSHVGDEANVSKPSWPTVLFAAGLGMLQTEVPWGV